MPGQIAAINMSQSGSDPQGHLTFNVRYPWGDPGVDLNVSERNIRWMPPKRHWYKGEPVVVNWEGRGNWYTASVVKVHRDGSWKLVLIIQNIKSNNYCCNPTTSEPSTK